MTQPLDRPVKHIPHIQIQNAYIELSEEGTRQFVRFVPKPWVIWVVGALVTWSVVGFTTLAIHTKLTSGYSCYASYATRTCQTQCGDAYFASFAVSALFVTVVGIIFQGIAILWHTSRLSLNHVAILFIVWGIFFYIVYVGYPFMTQIDATSWSSCMNPVLNTIGLVANMALVFIIPFIVSGALAGTVTNRIWRHARAQAADFSQARIYITLGDQSSGRSSQLKVWIVIIVIFLRGAIGMFQASDLLLAVTDNPDMYFSWVAPTAYLAAAVCLSSMLAAILMLRGKRTGLILAGSALTVELVLTALISAVSNILAAVIIPAILLFFVYSFYKREPERSWFT